MAAQSDRLQLQGLSRYRDLSYALVDPGFESQ
jgi:hypothetical protein